MYRLKDDQTDLLHQPPKLDEILEICNNNNYDIEYFVLEESSNKFIGSVINYGNDLIYIPIYPSGPDYELPYITDKNFKETYQQNLKTTLKILENIYKNTQYKLSVKP